MHSWAIDSWKKYPYEQSANYPSAEKLNQVLEKLQAMPPLVSVGEIEKLKANIAKAGNGDAFILQGGDCAESFDDCRSKTISNKLKILLQMSLVLIYGMRKPVIRVGRIAGQYAKPRSQDLETKNGITLPSYRGDLVNKPDFSENARTPNPKLLLQGYSSSAMTLNYIRALLSGGFASLNHPEQWDLEFVQHSQKAAEYIEIINSIGNAIDFLQSIDGLSKANLHEVDFYTSHEALHLHYEQALTRNIANKWYNCSTHFPWVGMRTAKQGYAHLEFLRGIENPVGIKVGPSTTEGSLVDIVKALNPKNEPGKIVLITRMGVRKIQENLAPLIKAVQNNKLQVTWSSDPMHGNTEVTKIGVKTRHFDKILQELKHSIKIHESMDSILGGVHFELTGDNVTECIGGARGLDETGLSKAYKTLVDPRLNYEQSLEMAFLLSKAIN